MFILAQFPDEIEKASVSFWYVKEGDEIRKDQPLIEFVTEKTSFTYQSPVMGKVIRLLVKEGQEVSNKQKIAEVETK
ncbi:MAG: lipoyl domain-containing protein [Candidatus Omnitrophica bacterium]|nr:lipoyl domain-containing protein [Candidatus Omnitrophota bacterium]